MEIKTNISSLDPITLELQEYSSTDELLISNFSINNISFTTSDIIEYHIYDFNKNLVNSDLNFKRYSLLDNNLNIDIQSDLVYYGFGEGQYKTLYNFVTNIFNSSKDNYYYISEISSDRTELRLSSTIINSLTIEEGYNTFVSKSNASSYYLDFYLNLGNNDLLIANNVTLDSSISGSYDLLIKLYEPLPNNFSLNSPLWIVEKIADSIAFSIENIVSFPEENGIITIKYKLALSNEFGEVCEIVYEDDKNINYIKITNEILEKWFGFEKIDVDYFKLKTENFYCNIDEQGFGFALEHDNFYICEYVHELQNLYFALIGKEITINV